MEEILKSRKKNLPHSPSKIKEILGQISNLQFEKHKESHKLEENESKIHELTKEVTALRNELEIEKQNLESKVTESEERNFLLQDLIKDKKNEELSLQSTESMYITKKKTKPSVRDLQLLERGKRKLKFYKEFTGIRWDYAAPENVIQGYITDKKDFLQKIFYKNEDYKKIRESLWKTIHLSTLENSANEDCKENKPSNK